MATAEHYGITTPYPSPEEIVEIETGVSAEVLAAGAIAVTEAVRFNAGFYAADYGPAKHRSDENELTPEDN